VNRKVVVEKYLKWFIIMNGLVVNKYYSDFVCSSPELVVIRLRVMTKPLVITESMSALRLKNMLDIKMTSFQHREVWDEPLIPNGI